jgi:hypothetical protein
MVNKCKGFLKTANYFLIKFDKSGISGGVYTILTDTNQKGPALQQAPSSGSDGWFISFFRHAY